MRYDRIEAPAYVVKAEQLPTLHRIKSALPEPIDCEWINRGTNQTLRPTTVAMLQRTLPRRGGSVSVQRLHESSGLRFVFRTEAERDQFARGFVAACVRQRTENWFFVVALFDSRKNAEQAVAEVIAAGIPEHAVSLLWRPGEPEPETDGAYEGHSKLSVVASVAGGGVAGALLGVAVMLVPGVGQIAAAGAIAAMASPIAAVSAVIGATGGAIARMLTDLDVDGCDTEYCERQIRRGRVFVAVDTRIAINSRDISEDILAKNGGVSPRR